MRSWSLIASGIASDWIGNGLMMLCAARAATMSSATPRSAKVFCNGLPRRAETVVPVVSWPAPAGAGDRNAVSASVRGGRHRLAPHRRISLSVSSADRVPAMADWSDPMTDDDRREALLDLLGVLAYGELIG